MIDLNPEVKDSQIEVYVVADDHNNKGEPYDVYFFIPLAYRHKELISDY